MPKKPTAATKAAATQSKSATRTKSAPPEPRMSALAAAARVLAEAGTPLSTRALIDAMAAQAYWSSPHGKTPQATLYAAILREIQTKGAASRFLKADRGLFTLGTKPESPAPAKRAARRAATRSRKA